MRGCLRVTKKKMNSVVGTFNKAGGENRPVSFYYIYIMYLMAVLFMAFQCFHLCVCVSIFELNVSNALQCREFRNIFFCFPFLLFDTFLSVVTREG